MVEAGNRVVEYLKQSDTISMDDVERGMPTAELVERLSTTVKIAVESGRDGLPEEIKAAVKAIEDNIDRIEGDSIIAALIIMARSAGRAGQEIIIGLETEWIPENNRGTLQHTAINPLMRELESLGDILRDLGLTNVKVIHRSSTELAAEVIREAEESSTSLSNVLVLAGVDTINMPEFDQLRSSKGKEKAFLAGVDPSELEVSSSSDIEINVIHIIRMLSIAMELAMGKNVQDLSTRALYDENTRTVIFLPKPEPLEYGQLKEFYNISKIALMAA